MVNKTVAVVLIQMSIVSHIDRFARNYVQLAYFDEHQPMKLPLGWEIIFYEIRYHCRRYYHMAPIHVDRLWSLFTSIDSSKQQYMSSWIRKQ